MTIRTLAYLLFFIGISAWSGEKDPQEHAYWIWAGITVKDAPTNSHLYLYDGVIIGENHNFKCAKKGIFPHPLKAKSVMLTYRVNSGKIDTNSLVKVFLAHAEDWRRHDVSVSGIQIDFDAPSSKLGNYAKSMAAIRKLLPVGTRLSVTGLADWAMCSDKSGIKALFDSVDEIVFQLYQVRAHIPDAKKYLNAIEVLGRGYKVGVLKGREDEIPLSGLKHLKGVVHFIQRPR